MESNRLDVEQIRHYNVNYAPPLADTPRHRPHYRQHQQTSLKQKLPLDTPSTSHGITRFNHPIQTIVQSNRKNNFPTEDPATPQPRSNSKILSVLEIKEKETKIRQRALSRASVNSEGGRKIFVSIAKSNRSAKDPSEGRQADRLNLSPGLVSNDKGLAQKIRLTKYMELKGSNKSRKE